MNNTEIGIKQEMLISRAYQIHPAQKPKRNGWIDEHMDGHYENSITQPPFTQTQFAAGITPNTTTHMEFGGEGGGGRGGGRGGEGGGCIIMQVYGSYVHGLK